MWLASALASLVMLAAGGWLLREAAVAGTRVGEVERRIVRVTARRAELLRFLRARAGLADAAQGAAEVVRLGAVITQASHQAIAAIPFGILERIGPTRRTTKVVRAIHDSTAEGIYSAIAGASEAIGGAAAERLTGHHSPEALMREVLPPGAPIEPETLTAAVVDPDPAEDADLVRDDPAADPPRD